MHACGVETGKDLTHAHVDTLAAVLPIGFPRDQIPQIFAGWKSLYRTYSDGKSEGVWVPVSGLYTPHPPTHLPNYTGREVWGFGKRLLMANMVKAGNTYV